MKLDEIKQILKLVDEAKLQEVEIEQAEVKIKIKRTSDQPAVFIQQQVQPVPPVPAQAQVHQAVQQHQPAAPERQQEVRVEVAEAVNLKTIKSPMTGTFYSSPSPDKPAFVAEGKEIKPGEPICIIEAMKLFNEIEAEESGVVEKILVKDGQPVELNQPLFMLKS